MPDRYLVVETPSAVTVHYVLLFDDSPAVGKKTRRAWLQPWVFIVIYLVWLAWLAAKDSPLLRRQLWGYL